MLMTCLVVYPEHPEGIAKVLDALAEININTERLNQRIDSI